jgi:FtsZ-binding cell division protein ZapB
MSAIPPNLPRFLPTLTEVVHAPVRLPVPHEPEDSTEQIIQRVMQRLDVSLESRVRQTIDTIVLEQLETLETRLRQEIQQVLRESVTEAVSLQLEAAKRER